MIPLRDTIRSHSKPVVTSLIILTNVLVFFYMLSLEPYSQNHFINLYALTPARFSLPAVITSMFLHGGWMHLIGNMWFLWVYGDNVEDVLGHGKYLIFYLACGVAASLAQYAISPDSRVPTLGASGAIAGVMGAYLVFWPRARVLSVIALLFFLPVYLPAAVLLAIWFGSQFVTSFNPNSGVAWVAHVGGFVAGAGIALALRGLFGPPRQRVRPAGPPQWGWGR